MIHKLYMMALVTEQFFLEEVMIYILEKIILIVIHIVIFPVLIKIIWEKENQFLLEI